MPYKPAYYPLGVNTPHWVHPSPIPKRIPNPKFNPSFDPNNPTNTPTMDNTGQLAYPWQTAAPSYIPGTNQIQQDNIIDRPKNIYQSPFIKFGPTTKLTKRQMAQLTQDRLRKKEQF